MPASIASGSQTSSAQSSFHQPENGTFDKDELLDDRSFAAGVQGVMYTVCKEKSVYGPVFICFRLLADWLQLFLLIVQPSTFNIPSYQLWWRIISFISLNQFFSIRGYTFFLAFFYASVAGLVLAVALSVWVGHSFRENKFDFVWPIITLRWFAKVFLQILDIATLSIFLIALDCQYFGHPAERLGYNQEFPDVYCWSMPHVIHAIVGVVSIVLFVILAAVASVGEMEMDFRTKNALAQMHTEVELTTLVIRFLMTFISTFVSNKKWQSSALLALACWLTYLLWYWQPQLVGWVNHVRTGAYSSVAWVAVLYVILAFNLGWDADNPDQVSAATASLTDVMWATTVPVGCVGVLASWWRLRWFNTKLLQEFKLHRIIPKHAYQFKDSRFVEILARSCRVWVDEAQLHQDAVLVAEVVLKVGLAQLPKDPFMVILYSSFLMDVQNSYQSGYTQLQHAKKMDAGFLMRFAMFSREQQHAQRSAAGSTSQGDGADLVSYVEFQRNYGLALARHTAALDMTQRFWQALMHGQVSFKTLSDTVALMDDAIKAADRVYKQVLERHSNHVKMVRLYAKFLEHIRQDPWSAAQWFAEAERLEAVEEEVKNHDTLGGLDMADPVIRMAMMNAGQTGLESGQGRGVIVMNAQSIIQITNQVALDMLGYTKQELKDRNLSIILPPQMAEVHASFVKAYTRTGRETALNKTWKQVVLHKDRRLIPIRLTVLKINGSGEDTMFLGIIEEIARSSGTATMWVSPDMSIMGMCGRCEDWLAHGREITGTKLSSLVVSNGESFFNGLKAARAALNAAHNKAILVMNGSGHMNNYSVHRGNRMLPTPPQHQQESSGGDAQEDTNPLGELKSFRFKHQSTSRLPSFARNALQGVTSVVAPVETSCEWHARQVVFAHKYAGNTVLDITIKNIGMGSFTFHAVTLKRHVDYARRPPTVSEVGFHPPHTIQDVPNQGLAGSPDLPNPGLERDSTSAVVLRKLLRTKRNTVPISHATFSQELLMVVSLKGHVVFVTEGLADLLGRSRQQITGNSSSSAFEGLLLEPFAQLHRQHISTRLPLVPPAFSCRSGLSVLMQSQAAQGKVQPQAVRVLIKQPRSQTSDLQHVIQVDPRTIAQALDERRLSLEVDMNGHITQVLSSHVSKPLYHLTLSKLVGSHIGSVVDVLQSDFFNSTDTTDGYMATSSTKRRPKVFMELVARSVKFPDASWRVAVLPMYDDAPPMSCSRHAHTKTVVTSTPAVLRIRPAPGKTFGQSTSVQVELWRSDLVTSVLQLDTYGYFVKPDYSELSELYPPGLLMGSGLKQLLDQHIGNFIPAMNGRSVSDLFVSGVLGPEPERARGPRQLRGNLKAKRSGHSGPTVGPQQLFTMVHTADAQDVQLCAQAVRKPSGTSPGVYLIVHAVKPALGRSNMVEFLRLPISSALPITATQVAQPGQSQLASLSSVSPFQTEMLPAPPNFALSTLGVSAVVTNMRRSSLPSGIPALKGRSESGETVRSEFRTQTGLPSFVIKACHRTSLDSAVDPVGASRRATETNLGVPFNRGSPRPRSMNLQTDGEEEEEEEDDEPVLQLPGKSFSTGMGIKGPEEEQTEEEDQRASESMPEDEVDVNHNSVGDGDFKRGQTFKKLHKLIGSALVQEPQENFHKKARIIVLLLCLVQLGSYITMYMLLGVLNNIVTDLMQIGRAGVLSTDIATWTRTINMIYAEMEVPTLRLMSTKNDLPYLKQLYLQSIAEFRTLHQGIYLGFGQQRRLPNAYGLRALWEDPVLPITVTAQIQYNQSLGNFTVMHNWEAKTQQGLWDAGNTLAQKAASFVQNAEAFNATLNGNLSAFADFPDLAWIITNAPAAIFPGYLDTLDAYLQLVLQKLASINTVQIILCIVEGLVVCGALGIWAWWLLERVAARRHSMFSIFMVVPSTFVRRLATRSHNLVDDNPNQEQEGDDDPLRAAQMSNNGGASGGAGGAPPRATFSKDMGGGGKSQDGGAADDNSRGSGGTAKLGFLHLYLRQCLPCLPQVEVMSKRSLSGKGKKKKLNTCKRTSIKLLFPILLWGALLLLCNAIGYVLLSNVSSPISLFNAVSYVQVLYNRNNFWLQELTYEPEPAHMDQHRYDSTVRVAELKKQYKVMLYGREVVPNETSFHYTSVQRGVTQAGTEGSTLLFRTQQCLCLNATECQATDTHLYPYTVRGLDRMMLKYLEIGTYIQQFQYLDPYLNGPEYDFYWNTVPDMKGGFQRLTEAYQQFVATNIKSVVTLHTVALVLTLLLVLGYYLGMLRPFSRTTKNEAKRIAELLSQLPAEVDTIGIVNRTLMAELTSPAGEAPPSKLA